MVLAGAPAWAGWIIEDIDGNKTYISSGMFKDIPKDGDETVVIMDLNKGVMNLIDHKRKSYISGTPEEFCADSKKMMDEMMKGMPPEARKMMEQMRESQGGEAAPVVKVTKQGSGGKVAGFDTVKYKVTSNGAPYAEVWITKDPKLMKELGAESEKLFTMSGEMEKCASMGMGGGASPELSPEYMKMEREGFPLREVVEGETVTEVVSIKKAGIPASEFQIPSGYRKTSFSEMMMEGMGR